MDNLKKLKEFIFDLIDDNADMTRQLDDEYAVGSERADLDAIRNRLERKAVALLNKVAKSQVFEFPPEKAPTIEVHIDKIFAGIYGRPNSDQRWAINAITFQFVGWINQGDVFDLPASKATAIHEDKFWPLWGEFLNRLQKEM